jgi:signal transduction histidine kinase
MDKVNILLVDDQPGKLLTYEAILANLGENLVPVKSGREALQFLLKEECALILLDIVMPDMDGFETAAVIRQRQRLERTPIIFVTAYSTSDLDRIKGYQYGAIDVVFAPIVPEILRAKVLALVELYRVRRELAQTNEQLLAEIVERRRAQELALQAERLAAIGQMVAGLAHESRNALQQIQASVEMLSRRIRSQPESSLVVEIQKAHDRIHRLLEEVRGYSAPLKLNCEVYDLSAIWNEAWRQLSAAHKGRDVQFHVDTGDLDLRCLVDGFPIERVFGNILENSLSACADPVRIAIQCSAAELNCGGAIRIRIADNGVGLTDEQRRHIFEPFYTTKTSGTGLGMAIAKRIVEAHGGKIAVADERGPGTTIEILLPRRRS